MLPSASPNEASTHPPKDLRLKVDGEKAVTHGGEDEGDEGDPNSRDLHHLPDGHFA